VIAIDRLLGHRLAEGPQPLGVQVLDRSSDDVHLGWEMVEHGASRQTGLLRDDRGGGPGVAEFHQALDGGLDDLGAREALFWACQPTGVGASGVTATGLHYGRSLSVCCHALSLLHRRNRNQKSFICQSRTHCLKKSNMIETG